MNTQLRVFKWLVWFGILVNAAFWVPAWFAPPAFVKLLGIDPNFHTIWLRNVGMLLLLVAIFNWAGTRHPREFPLYSWLVVLARIIAGLFFLEVWLFNSFSSSDRPELFLWFFLVDTTFGVTKGVFLYLGLRNPPSATSFLAHA